MAKDAPSPDNTDETTPSSPATDTEPPKGPRTIYQTIIAVMRDVRAVGKDGFNEQQKFKFRGIDGVMNAVGPAMREHGLMVFPISVEKEHNVGTSKTGGALHLHRLHVTFRLANEDGDHLDVEVPSESMDSSDKGTAKAMSVALRIALLQTLALPTEDRDPDEDYHQLAAPQQNGYNGPPPQGQPAPTPPPVRHAPVPDNWREYVTRAEADGNLALLEQMEASAAAHGNTEARSGIAAARLRVKRAAANGTPPPTPSPEEAKANAEEALGAREADAAHAAAEGPQDPPPEEPSPAPKTPPAGILASSGLADKPSSEKSRQDPLPGTTGDDDEPPF